MPVSVIKRHRRPHTTVEKPTGFYGDGNLTGEDDDDDEEEEEAEEGSGELGKDGMIEPIPWSTLPINQSSGNHLSLRS